METMDKLGDVCNNTDPRQILKKLLRLAEAKLDLVWRFEAGEEITSLCIANYIKNWEFNKQILIGSKDSCVYSLSIDKKLLWKFCANDEILSLFAADLNNEGSEEIIVASKDHHIYALDAEGRLIWKYKCEGPLKAVAIAKKGTDNLIAAGSSNGYIYLIKYKEGLQWKYYCGDNCTVNGLCVTFLGENERDNIIAVTNQGDVIILDYQKQRILRRFKKPGSIYAVIAQDIDNDSLNEIVICSDSCCVYALNSSGREKWRFKTKDSVYSIHCCDIDIDNRFEIIIGTKDDFVYVLNANGQFQWKYKTDHNVWSIYSAPLSHPKFYDLFAGLSNRKVYYYKLLDWRLYSSKIEQAYNQLLNNDQSEWKIIQDLSRDEDNYLRRFAVQKMIPLTNDPHLILEIFSCLRNMLNDPSPMVRSAVIKNLAGLADHYSELVLKTLSTENSEQDEEVRNNIIHELSHMALKMPVKRGEVFNHIQRLNHQWEQIDRKAIINLSDIAQNEFITGNIKKALMDFQLLNKRGVDLIWKQKTDGYVCSLAYGDIDQNNPSVIILASRDNHLYVYNHRAKLKWDKLTETYTQRVLIEDIDNDGRLEIVIGGANGTFQYFSGDGEEKGGFLLNNQVNDFHLIKNTHGADVDFIVGCQDGTIYYLSSTGKEKWRFQAKVCVLSVWAEDINNDGQPEIAVGTLHGRLLLLDQKGNLLWEKDFQNDIRTITSLREKNDVHLIIGTRKGDIYALNTLGQIIWEYSCNWVINKIWICKIPDEVRILISSQHPSILVLNAKGNKTGEIETCGSITSMACGQHGQKEIILGSEDNHVYIYQFVDKQKIDQYIKKCLELSKITEKKLTFQRNDILKLIKINFESRETKKKVVLVGYRGTGKTQLLWQIHSGELGETYLPVYINLQYTKLISLPDFVSDLSEKITNDLWRKEIPALCPSKSELTENYFDAFNAFFKDVTSKLEQKILLILLDDFDKLQSEVACGNLSDDIFRLFEEMIQTKKCYFVLTTSSYNSDLNNENDFHFLSDALIKEVNFIDRFDAQRGLIHQLKDCLADKEEVVSKILFLTGCHAHFLQIIFNLILAHLQKTKKRCLIIQDWSEIYSRLMETIEVELQSPWKSCLPWEKVVLSSLAGLPKNSFTISDIETSLDVFTLLISSYQLANMLRTLAKKSILNELFTGQEIQYNFTIPLFRDWVKNKTNPFQVISENAATILSNVPLRLFYRQHKLIQEKNQTEVFLQTIGLEAERWEVLVKLSQKWSKLIDSKGKTDSDSKILNDFVRYFVKLLSFSVKEVLLSSKLTGFRLETPTIRLKKLAGMILVVPNNSKPDEADFQALMGLIGNLEEASNVFLILELENSYVFEKLVSDSKLDLVLLNEQGIEKIFLSFNYLRALLEEVILKHVDFVDLSPYETMGPVSSMFFGRLKEIKTMRQLSHKSFAIVGARQLGKTSLMLKVRDILSLDPKIQTLYLDCSTYDDPLSLCRAIIDGIDFGHRLSIENLGEFKQVIREWCKKQKIKLALFLDEIDTLLAFDMEQKEILFKTFRALSQENIITLVVAGYEELFLRTKDIKSPLFNYLELIKLSFLDKKAATQLITEPMKELGIHLQDEKALVNGICKITSCFPNLIQYLCKRLIQLIASKRRRVIYISDVAEIEKDPDFQDYLISRLFSNLSPLGKIIVLLTAEDQKITLSLIDEKLRGNSIHLLQQELYEEIDKILMASVFAKTEQGLKFTLPHFSHILYQNMEKELLLKQLLREVDNERS